MSPPPCWRAVPPCLFFVRRRGSVVTGVCLYCCCCCVAAAAKTRRTTERTRTTECMAVCRGGSDPGSGMHANQAANGGGCLGERAQARQRYLSPAAVTPVRAVVSGRPRQAWLPLRESDSLQSPRRTFLLFPGQVTPASGPAPKDQEKNLTTATSCPPTSTNNSAQALASEAFPPMREKCAPACW